MSVSVIPHVIDALVTLATTNLPNLRVYDGFGVTNEPGDFLMVGVDDPDNVNRAQAGMSRQDWATIGAKSRDEQGEVTCVALSWNGDGNLQASRNAAFATAEAVASICRNDPDFSAAVLAGTVAAIPGLLWTSYGSETNYITNQDDQGAMTLVVFRVAFKARI